jgi:hypothetical protein
MKKDKEEKQKTDAEIIGDAMFEGILDEYYEYFRCKYLDYHIELVLNSKWYNRWWYKLWSKYYYSKLTKIEKMYEKEKTRN